MNRILVTFDTNRVSGRVASARLALIAHVRLHIHSPYVAESSPRPLSPCPNLAMHPSERLENPPIDVYITLHDSLFLSKQIQQALITPRVPNAPAEHLNTTHRHSLTH